MGQNVNYLLGNQSQLMGADPETYRQQLIQAEQARIGAMPVQNQVGAQLGNLLGRGLTNIAQDRNFFEVTNPVLQKLTKIQSIYDTAVQSSDPNDPMSFYTTLQKQFAQAGLGRESLMAQVEGKKFEGVDVKNKTALTELYAKNPGELSDAIARAQQTGDEAALNKLTTLKTTIESKREREIAKEAAQIGLINAQTKAETARAQNQFSQIEAGKNDWKVVNDENGFPAAFAIFDKKSQKITYEKIGGGAYTPGVAPPSATAPKKGERPPINNFNVAQPQVQPTPAPVAAPVAQPMAQPVATPTEAVPPQAANSNTPSPLAANGEYRAVYDPVFLGIQQAIAQEPNRLGSDPAFLAAIVKAKNDRVAQLRQQYGNMVNFTGVN